MNYSPAIPDPTTSRDTETSGMLNICSVTGREMEAKELVCDPNGEVTVYVSRDKINQYVEGLEFLDAEEKEQLINELKSQK
jgi:hypothetical protein